MQSYSTEPEPCPSLAAHPWRNKNLVVFVVDIVHPGYFRSALRRELAHARMKEILKKYVLRCNLPELHTICAFGTQVAFYKYDIGRRKMQPGDASSVEFIDVISQEGFKKVHQIMAHIREMASM
ncbi:hypothetical protein BDQ17DRAFT_1337655 [Cyathus striatus]|nr:hypothetical protein BDQ17DRAFT_1337655 [Cyathus striatus]